jgi:hypothetical protein
MIANVLCLNTASSKTGKKLADITSKNCSVPFLKKMTQISRYIYDPFTTSIKIPCAPRTGKERDTTAGSELEAAKARTTASQWRMTVKGGTITHMRLKRSAKQKSRMNET